MMNDILVLGIETSCDETAVSVVKNGREVLSNVISSQIDIHKVYGGVVPEIASRAHVEIIDSLTKSALDEANVTIKDIDAVAVTYGPGLVGALLVGVNFAKALAYANDKPLIPVHHISGHIAALYITHKDLQPPFIALVASGGHSHLCLVKDYLSYEIIGRTRDDACGEAFDKIARALGLPYPGGPAIENAAKTGDKNLYEFPDVKVRENIYDFSFSGIKSAALNLINSKKMNGEEIDVNNIAASFQNHLVNILTDKAISACKEFATNKLAIAGGVSANGALREVMEEECKKNNIDFFAPEKILSTDNAAMIASQGYFEYLSGHRAGLDLNANPMIGLGGVSRK